MKHFFVWICFWCWAVPMVEAQQERILIHAHNDYHQRVPFYQAYAQQVYAIEADVFAENGAILVGHDRADLHPARTLEALYINPIVHMFSSNAGRAWAGSENRFVLLIDLKTPAATTLQAVVRLIAKHPDVFDETVNPYAATVVISGAMPTPAMFADFPHYIRFDGRLGVDYTEDQLERLEFISAPFSGYARWNGKGALTDTDEKQVSAAIEAVHQLGKKIRFWGTPDGITAWNTLHGMGVDIINTDQIERCAAFFSDFGKKRFSLQYSLPDSSTARAKRLDATTRGFRGFEGEEMVLSATVPVYKPLTKFDGQYDHVKNVILLIGDGMGLAQLQAAYAFNRSLSTLLIPTIGLQETSSLDAYTTDSAGAGSALATGEKTKNRHISVDSMGHIRPSITDYAKNGGMATGVVTAGNVADATPAAFYGHAVERDDSDALTAYLMDGKLDVLIGSGRHVFSQRKDGRELWSELSEQYRMTTELGELDSRAEKAICIDERFGEAVSEKTMGLLAEATRRAIRHLDRTEEEGFFLMVEGAKIDYAGHANSLPGSIMETLSFDLAVAEALKFADEDGNTLVVVTGDHETGGLTLIDGNWEKNEITALYMTDDHTPIMLPVFAYGPGSDGFKGVYPNTAISHKIMRLLNPAQRTSENKTLLPSPIYRLIAHRGGVVDRVTAENSLPALKKASKNGYWMVEVDLRLTRDSVLIIHHDPNFKKYFGVDKAVSEMDWAEISQLVGNLGNKVLTFEEALRFCQAGNLQVMVDNKIKGNDTVLFGRVVELLKKYNRLEQAMMIGTTASTPFFTGKIKLSCTRQQLEDYLLKPGFDPEDYYLFASDINEADVEWTRKHGVLAVGVLNAWAFRDDDMMEEAENVAEKLKNAGVSYYQLDSMFDFLFE